LSGTSLKDKAWLVSLVSFLVGLAASISLDALSQAGVPYAGPLAALVLYASIILGLARLCSTCFSDLS
jgi:hypothetical protein